jgi:archaellum component FlaC
MTDDQYKSADEIKSEIELLKHYIKKVNALFFVFGSTKYHGLPEFNEEIISSITSKIELRISMLEQKFAEL